MNAGNWFWVIYVILAIFGGWFGFSSGNRWATGFGVAILVLLGLVGWGVFGPPLK
jgi:hypothetical protein